MLKSGFRDYNMCILVKETIMVTNMAATTAAANNNGNNKVILKNCVPFTACIRKTNNKQAENAKDIDAVIPCIM